MRGRRIFILVIALVLQTVLFEMVFAEGEILHDYSSDLIGFCHAVAKRNNTTTEKGFLRSTQPQQYNVVCRTDDALLQYETTSPLSVIQGPENRYVLTYATQEMAESAVALFRTQAGVLYAECDAEVVACEADTVSFRSEGANLLKLAGFLQLAQNYGKGSQTVAIVDSGVSTHSILRGRIREYGYDYIDADDDPTNDLSGHGTHIAGIIVDCTADTPVWLYPIRVLNRMGSGKMSNVVAAVLEATNAGADVINLSLESFEMSEALDDAIESAVNQGTTVVIAAGNHACDTSEVCPAHLTGEGMIVVGSVEATETGYRRADYSNYGKSVDLYAFGSNINSCSRSGGYVVQSGTSMAAAHISAVCALIGLTHPDFSPQAIEGMLTSVCVGEGIKVLDTTGFVPLSERFYLTNISLGIEDTLPLPMYAAPSTSQANITWESRDESIASVDSNGNLHAKKSGITELTADCMGFERVSITVTVYDWLSTSMTLPISLKSIEDEAFINLGGEHYIIPDGVERLGSKTFAESANLKTIVIPDSVVDIGSDLLLGSEQAIILCGSGSIAQSYADEYRLQYIELWD